MRRSTPVSSNDVARQIVGTMLWRKLWADTRALAGQTIALAVLIGLGVLLFIGLYEAYQNLTLVYNRIYDSTRFADASVLLESAPASLVDTARTIPHVRAAIGRVVRDGAIIQPGRKRERVLGRFIGVPRGHRPQVNDLWILDGGYVSNTEEAVLEHQFARDNDYEVGDRIKCSYQSREREFTVVGLAASPEYVYPVPSKHTMFVARGIFGVVFILEDRVREWCGVGPQINEIHCLTDPGYEHQVLEKLEGLTRSYGLEFAYVQDEQPSKRLLDMDQQGFAQLSVFFPILFLTSAGLSLYGALTRIVRLQVTVIGTLRACGFGRQQILVQYVMQGVLVALGGAVPGVALGHLLAVGMNRLYADALHLPVASAVPQWGTILTGLALAAGTGLAAAYLPARLAANLLPAVAMRGEVESGRRLQAQRLLVKWTRLVRVVYRIPLRGIFRRASRTLFAVAGIAGGASIIITTFGTYISTMDAIDEYITDSRKYHIDLQFARPGAGVLAQAASGLPGGRAASLTVSVPVRIRSSWGSGELILTGLERGQKLLRVNTVSGRPMTVEPGKVWLPKQLGHQLHVEAGDPVRMEWVKASRRRRLRTTMQVAGLLDVAMGNSAYGEFHDVRRSLADQAWPYSSYGANFECDPTTVDGFKHRFERSDDVMLVSTTADVIKEINEQMAMLYIFIGVLLGFGSVLAGSAIHSVASVSLLERTRELASLRSLGFSAWTTAWLAGVELFFLAVVGLIVGLPLGAVLNRLFMGAYQTENMQFRAILHWWVYLITIIIVLVLVIFSAYIGARRLRAIDLSQATKALE